MFDAPLDLKNARILVTNDDGVETPGIELLEKIARGFSDDVWVVAPRWDNTGAGHSITFHTPFQVEEIAPRHFAVHGTPTDCVLLACKELLADKKPTLLLSGVNPGPNLAENVTYSGTISAAFEGTLLGVPSIAFSVHGTSPYCWEAPTRFTADIIRKAVSVPWPKDVLINVNFPNVPVAEITGIFATRQGRSKLEQRITRGEDADGKVTYRMDWILPKFSRNVGVVPETDIEAIGNNAVSVCPLNLDFTDKTLIDNLKRVLD